MPTSSIAKRPRWVGPLHELVDWATQEEKSLIVVSAAWSGVAAPVAGVVGVPGPEMMFTVQFVPAPDLGPDEK